jgi:hypothetical protein
MKRRTNLELKIIRKIYWRRYISLVFVLLCFGGNIFAQSSVKAVKPDQRAFFGTLDGGKYKNPFFGLELQAPQDYTVLDSQQSQIYVKAGADLLSNNEQTTKQFDEALLNQATLLGVFQKPMGSPGNSVLEIVVRKQAQGVTANLALAANVSIMTSTGKYKLIRSIENAKFGGLRFSGALVQGEFNSIKLTSEFYVVMRRGYSFHMVVTYSTEEGRKSMIAVLDTLKFT